ncbi:site-specific integrase [Pseudomonas sp. H9]|uniref:tyrosine-type recombinase/integrase n=1 Tax=Pseudomonas sp. H9 TaxID=483968 RepID=UPI00105763CD|nr:site-specific integrase [Pseudomonas sp. H9]TDF77717.1 site-specific integrase [Pseudomonas sp. H9]
MHITYVKLERKSGTRYKAIIRDGDRVIATKTCKLKTDATTWAKSLLRDEERLEALGNPHARVTLATLADDFLNDWKGRDHALVGRINALVALHGKKRLVDISEAIIRDDLDAYAPGHCAATINRRKACWSALLQYAVKKGFIKDNPARRTPTRTEDNERVRWLEDDERKRLLVACDACASPLLKPLVILAMATGARLGELLGLRWEQIDFSRRTAVIARTKNGDPRTLVFPAPAIAVLMTIRKPSGLVFDHNWGFRWHWGLALKAAKLDGLHFHDLRHDAASQLVMAGASMKEVAEILGHKTLESTNRYAHLSTDHKKAVADRVMGEVFGRLK